MSARERCPQCHVQQLAPRTNGDGLAYLDCLCGYIEPIRRQADPYPSTVSVYVDHTGVKRTRLIGSKGPKARGPYREKGTGHGKGTTRLNRKRPSTGKNREEAA